MSWRGAGSHEPMRVGGVGGRRSPSPGPRQMMRASTRSPSPSPGKDTPVAAQEDDVPVLTPENTVFPSSFAASEPLTTPHTITVLIVSLLMVLYANSSRAYFVSGASEGSAAAAASSDGDGDDTNTNIEAAIAVNFTNVKTGILAAVFLGVVFCTEHLRDTLLIRPHPAVWRAATGIGLMYFMFVVFLLFQNMPTIQSVLQALDPELPGHALPERSYANDCSFTWEAFIALFDRFVVAHFVGWWAKTLMLRDPVICWILSLAFEVAEIMLSHVQPNFQECFLDRWVLDFLLCNGGGIMLGTYTLRLLDSKAYDWGGLSSYRSLGAKLKRGLAQFTPIAWQPYQWRVLSSAKRFFSVVGLLAIVLAIELNAFFLKDLLWVPPESPLNIYRLVIWFLLGNVALKDVYVYSTDPKMLRFGPASWLALGAVVTECLIIWRFAVTKYSGIEAPYNVRVAFLGGLSVFFLAATWWFTLGNRRYRVKTE